MLLNATAPTPVDLINRVLGASSRAVRDAWSHVGPRAVEGASTGRVFAAFLHVFVSVPFVVATIDLALATARTFGDRLFPVLSFALFGAVAIVTVIAVTLFVSGALIGAAGVLTHIQSHKAVGQAAMAAGVFAGAAFVVAGDFVLGWTTAIVAVGAFLAQTATWAIDRRAA